MNLHKSTDLSHYDNSWYNPGGGPLKRVLWYFVNTWFINCGWNPVVGVKVRLLRLFGAKIGKGVMIKPNVNIKYPWHLKVGDYVWIGEDVWIDNLVDVSIGAHACLSQGAMLLCGNHDFTTPTFDLIVKPIVIEDGGWVGAKSIVCPGVTMGSHSMLVAGSVASKDLMEYSVYRGNPAVKVKDRKIE